MSDPERLRLFIAIEIPETWRTALDRQTHALDERVPGFGRWVDPGLMHLTLLFLASQSRSVLPGLERAMNRAAGATASFTLSAGELGSFGGPKALRVIWSGVSDSPSGTIDGLHRRLSDAVSSAGIIFDSAPFRPHLTLGRARRDTAPALSQAMSDALWAGRSQSEAKLQPFTCTELVLIRSDLRRSGPIYTPLHRAPLGGA